MVALMFSIFIYIKPIESRVELKKYSNQWQFLNKKEF